MGALQTGRLTLNPRNLQASWPRVGTHLEERDWDGAKSVCVSTGT